MESDKVKIVFEKAIEAMITATPMIGPVAGILLESARDAETASESGEIAQLQEEARRQEISLQMARMQAQVAQELAIAHRIENAEEVEIEEYYVGEAGAGLSGSTDGLSANFSLGGQGRKVTKRIYRFTGKSENT
ncbi:hypothetical protein [Microbulbifer spongiae]|uniref:Uncharacterized protein n=1 Tax=Microbulbifer spongiae TaxID=2944933 RepID=A0ABY9EEV1_9GAMM|nr:hypothetical protein [Microbulbifer sp. MI-G]WKD50521.1 hypothetical protein M8T91_03565 [Microbulbifer sp. MI-G]